MNIILCSHYVTVGQTVWQTVARSVHTLRRFDESDILLHIRLTFSRTYQACWIRATERETVGQTVCQTVA